MKQKQLWVLVFQEFNNGNQFHREYDKETYP